ncbi:hypothetical protein CC2G_005312 [Coprinopsis cinerea AmutBmut pab1-1]|nr:hypothetical protein CC2G_005312 [Coprinopsis cinerea AmutBmut pab1-1]KAG2019920.1 hypothetical protein CC2G_005312 [Coprinopsis cinerea AmutBmut pab1-1]
MRTLAVFALLAVSAGTALAAPYPGDIVQYWNLRTTWSINATNPRQGGYYEAYAGAFVQTAILAAAQDASRHPRAVQQLSVSYAAHDALASLYDLQYQTIDSYLTEIEDIITPTSSESSIARRIGESAAAKVTRARAGDGYGRYKRYEWQAPAPGVYQPTPPNNPFPAAQHGGQLRPWGGVEKVPEWGPPPSPTDDGYEKFLLQVKEKGSKTNSTRTADETEIGYFWLESSITAWNRYATTIIGDSLKDSVLKSAEFYAKLNWALANAAIVSTHTKNKYNAWRPITALHYPGVFLKSGNSLRDPSWEPLFPNPGHQDYLSGHAVFGGSAVEVLRNHLGSDELDPPVTLTSHVMFNNVGPISRTFTSLSQAAKENGDSRVFVGVHFQFASDEGTKAGEAAAKQVLRRKGRGYL